MNLPNISKDFTVVYEPDEVKISGISYKIIEKDDISLSVKNNGGKKIAIKLAGRFVFNVPCGRCLVPQRVEVPVDFENEIDMSLSNEERASQLDETEYINGYDLLVDRLVYEEILLGFPMKVLCDEDCKGLCKVCGANLNLGECGCDRTELDPRMAAIRDIFKSVKEV
ncbi:MAG: DUF177 domain-containing protein [Lachnospiraceae bacterium]|nr:DUF177 domain-containing protein [Lachnospiraceae bacterium]